MKILKALSILSPLFLFACSDGKDLEDSDVSQYIAIDDAIASARAEVPDGTVLEAALEIEDDADEPSTFEVLLLRSEEAKLIEVEIDAVTGEVLEVSHEDD